jgi:hypothetical protein
MVKYAPNGNSKFGLIDIADEVEDVGSTAAAPVRANMLNGPTLNSCNPNPAVLGKS